MTTLRNPFERSIPYRIMTELNPIIKAIAEHYKFEIRWCDVMEHWIIRNESANCVLFWRSDYHHPLENFLDELKSHFEQVGREREAHNF